MKKIGIVLGVSLAIYLVWRFAIKPAGEKQNQKPNGKIKTETANLYQDVNGIMNQMKSTLKKGDPVTVCGETNGYWKIDCDGIYVKKTDVEILK